MKNAKPSSYGHYEDSVAIIGISCEVPDARDYREFWENIRGGKESARLLDRQELERRGVPRDLIDNPRFVPVELAVGGKDYFDAEFFNIPRNNAVLMDPQFRLLLQHSWKAVEDGGYLPKDVADCAVFVATSNNYYSPAIGRSIDFEGSEDYVAWMFAQGGSVPTRISYELGLRGPSMSVHTNCSSSLVALSLAYESLKRNEAKYALVGASKLFADARPGYLYEPGMNFASDGHCRAFDAAADGMIAGEGAAVLLLKRAADAIADGDNIYALVRGVGINNDGADKAGFYAPSISGQAEAIEKALREAAVEPDTIAYVEAHGTGTKLGDPIEIEALTEVYKRYGVRNQYCAIGSVKPNIGHLDAAAGLAGCIKAALSLKYGIIPRSINYTTRNPFIDFENSPFYVADKEREWPAIDGPRRAGVSAFGIGGTNAHVILESFDPIPGQAPGDPAVEGQRYLLPLSAQNRDRLLDIARNLLAFIESPHADAVVIRDVAYTLQVGREAMTSRLAFVASDFQDLTRQLRCFVSQQETGAGYFQGEIRKGTSLGEIFDDGDSTELMQTFIAKKNFAMLAKLWVSGAEIDWALLHDGRRPRRVSLPTYAFAREVCRAAPLPGPVAQDRDGAGLLHPLLHSNTSTGFDTRFTSTFSGEEFFLRDHRIGGVKVLPAVAHLEMAQAAIRQAFGLSPIADASGGDANSALELKDVVWLQPAFSSGDRLELHISVALTSDTEAQFEIYGIDADDNEVPYSQGRGRFLSDPQPPPVDLARLQSICTAQPVTADAIRALFETQGAHIGPGHQAIQAVHAGPDERQRPQVLTTLRMPDLPGEFGLHPGLLDSALQAYMGLYSQSALADLPLSLPFALSSIAIYSGLPKHARAWLRFSEGSDAGDASPKIDATVCDEHGNVCAVLTGLMKRARRPAGAATAVSASLFKPRWQAAPVEPAGEPISIVDHHHVLLVGAFTDDQRDALQSALSDRVPLRHLWVRDGSIAARYTHAAEEVLDYIRQLFAGKPRQPVLVQIIGHPADRFFAGLAGLLRTANLENAKLATQYIELTQDADTHELTRIVRENARDLTAQTISYRQGERFVKCYDEAPLASGDDAARFRADGVWKDDGIYLITGGLGGLGLIFARDIAARTRGATVILANRSPLDAERQSRIDALTASGLTVDFQCVDLADMDAVTAMFDHIRRAHGNLTAILHSAGVVHDSYIINKHADEVRKVFAPKVAGLINLDEASKNLPLERFVLFSSIAATLGNIGQADYAAANGFMDAYAEYRNDLVSLGGRSGATVSINWPGWATGGMDVDIAIHEQKRLQGFSSLSAEQGLDAYAQGLRLGGDHFVVLIGDHVRLLALLSESLMAAPKGVAAAPSLQEAIAHVDVELLRSEVQRLLQQQVSDHLHIPVQDIELDSELSGYGFDSISFTRFSNQLNERLELDLAPTIFFEYPTMRSFADFLVEEHGPHLSRKLDILAKSCTAEATSDLTATPEALVPIGARRRRKGFGSAVQPVLPLGELNAREPIAIIGMSGRFPQAPDLDALWGVLKAGRDCITEIPAERWDWREVYGDPDTEGNKTNVKWAGFIEGIDQFDPFFFNISPAEARMMDPQQRLLMTYAWSAIEDAGYAPSSLSGSSTGIFVGTVNSDYHKLIAEAGVPINSFSSIGTAMSLGPNRVSYQLNLSGPSEPIETACSSSLVAIHRAVRAIHSGDCDQALVGGVNTIPSPWCHIAFSKVGALSKDGRCKTFSKDANGFVRAEGVGMLLLKRLSAAERDGDRIYAVIKGTAENHGGRGTSFSAPNPKAQAELLKAAYRDAHIDPRTVTYIEAHGSGTPLGDPIEINGLKSAFSTLYEEQGEPGAASETRCGVGTLKTNIGHSEFAAGVAGVIKVILQMQHKTLAKSLHSEPINPYIDLKGSPFFIVQEEQAWEALEDANGTPIPRRAGVSSFGFGGVNCHVVLEEYAHAARLPELASRHRAPAIIVVSAKTEQQLLEQARNLHTHLQHKALTDDDLPAIAYTLQVGRDAMEHRLAMIVTSINDLSRKLQAAIAGEADGGGSESYHKGTKGKDQGILAALIADDDFADTVSKWVRQEKFDKLLELWVNGLSIDWDGLYRAGAVNGGVRPRRISLPTYAFAKERYWVDGVGVPIGQPVASTTQLHPLVHQNVSTIFATEFTATFSGEEFFLKDHQVRKMRIFPAAAYLEMASVAIRHAFDRLAGNNDTALELRDVVWLRPATASAAGLTLRVRVLPDSDSEARFEIYSLASDGEEQLHSQGRARFFDAGNPAPIDLAQLRQISVERPLKRNELYRAFSDLGVDYGPGYQALEDLHAGRDAAGRPHALAALRMPDVPGVFGLHPGLLDSALHAFVGLHLAGRSASTLADLPVSLPFALSSVAIYDDLPQRGYSWARYGENGNGDACIGKLDVSICDEAGRVCAVLTGLSTRVVEPAAENLGASHDQPMLQPLLPNWDVIDGAALREVEVALPNAGTTLLVSVGDLPNANLWRTILPGAIEDGGLATRSLDDLTAHFSAMGELAQVLWVLPHDASGGIDDEALIAEQASGVLFGLRLMKALLASVHGSRELQLTVVTWQTLAIASDGHYPAHASVHGLMGSLAKEIPHWSVRVLDLPLDADEDTARRGLSLPFDPQGEVWACRRGQWYRPQLLRANLPAPGGAASPYCDGGVYVVIGGAGGIGEVLSEHLIRQHGAQLVWLGRREPDDEIEAKLDRLSALGPRPLYLQADATDREALAEARQQVLSRFGVIHGIVHSAIVLHDKSVAMMDEERFTAALRAKVDTSVRLAQVFRDDALDFILFFSSLQSFAKAPGQSNYAAGCTFADSFADLLRRSLPCPIKVMNWGYWGSVGRVADQLYRDRAKAAGVGSIEPDEGLAALREFLVLPVPQLAVMSVSKPEALDGIVKDSGQGVSILVPGERWDALFASSEGPLADRLQAIRPPIMNKAARANHDKFEELQLRLLGRQLESLGDRAAPILPMYDGWLAEAKRRLAEAPYAEAIGNGPPAAELWVEWNRLKAGTRTAGLKEQMDLVGATLSALPDILTGSTPATDVLFPAGSMDRVEAIYKHNPRAAYFNTVLSEAVVTRVAAMGSRAPQSKLRLLEIGAGTGGTSESIFRALEPYRDLIEVYSYTDISKAFLIHAERSYRGIAPYLECRLFNIERGPAEQGIKPGNYDVVVAANVLHATRDIRRTLRHAKATLRAGGVLLLNEITENTLFAHLTFGLTEGWWLSDDAECRITGSPILSVNNWHRVLDDEGFGPIQRPAASAEDLGHQIIIAHSDGFIRQATRPDDITRIAPVAVVPPATDPARPAPPPDPLPISSLRERTEAFIKEEISTTLQIPLAQLDSQRSLNDYGVDSILGAQVTRNLGKVFEEVSSTLLFEHSTIAELTDFFVGAQADRLRAHFGMANEAFARADAAERGRPAAETSRAAADPAPRLKNTVQRAGRAARGEPPVASEPTETSRALSLRERTEAFIKEEISTTLQIPLAQLDSQRSLNDYGVDSILGAQVTRNLGKVFEEVSSTLLFEHSTIAELTDFFVGAQADRLRAQFGMAADAFAPVSAVAERRPDDAETGRVLLPSPCVAATPAPVRLSNSVRRTSSIDVSWPEGDQGDRLLVGRVRDYRTPAPGGSGELIEEAEFRAVLAPDKTITSIQTTPPLAKIGQLVNVRAGIHSRLLINEAMPELLGEGAPIYLPLDDIPGTASVSALAWSYFYGNWAERICETVKPEDLERVLSGRRNACWGLQDGSSGLRSGLGGDGPNADAGDLRNPADPQGWHAFPTSDGPGFRRARRIDVTHDKAAGLLHVDSGFQDSAKRGDGGRVAIHEYHIGVTIDAGTLEILSLHPQARVLPFAECPGAVANTQRLVGTRVTDIRGAVSSYLHGLHGCTHLNDALRALAEVPKLAVYLESANCKPLREHAIGGLETR